MTIRRASPLDAELLAQHRAEVWHEVGEWKREQLARQIPVWTEFFRTCVENGSYVAFVAEDAGKMIGSGAILVHLTIPRPGLHSDRAGRVQSVYVVPAARRRGIARTIVERLLTFAKESKLVSLSLRSSEEARSLYLALGFEVADEMTQHFT